MQISSCPSRCSLPFITLFKAPHRVTPENVHVKVHHCHQRQCVPDVDNKCINEHWTHLQIKQVSNKPTALFNALKFRVHNVNIPEHTLMAHDNKNDSKSKNVCCELWLGITDYKSSIGTTTHIASYEDYALNAPINKISSMTNTSNSYKCNNEVADVKGKCVLQCNTKDIHCYLSNALGVESIAVTSDGKAVLFRRSQDVAEYKGYYCCPGGHPEPARLIDTFTSKCDLHCDSKESENAGKVVNTINDRGSVNETREDDEDGFVHNSIGNDNNNNNNSSNSHISENIDTVCSTMMNSLTSQDIVNELFQSIVCEVADELGLDLDKCHNYGLMGIMEATSTCKPDLCFWVQLDYASDEVQSCFDARCGTDAFESVAHSLRFIPIDQLSTEESVHEFVKNELHGLLTPSSYAALVHAVNYKNYIPFEKSSTSTNTRLKE